MKKTTKKDGVITIDTRQRWFNIALILICFVFLLGVRFMVNPPATGDEPHYLIMDHSLIYDRDLSLSNNYDHVTPLGLSYSVLSYQGWPHVETSYASKQYSAHGAGLSLFLLPGFFVGKYSGTVIQMVMLATLVVWLTWVWTLIITKNRKMAYLTAFILTICYFFNTLAGSVYPDMMMAALTLLALIGVEKYYKKPFHQLLIGVALGFLVLVHLKTIVVAGPVLLLLCYKTWKTERKLPWLAIYATGMFVLYYFLTLYQWFGVWSLSHVEGGQSFSASPKNNLTALLFDANRGLLVYNPILLLLFVGLPIWLKKHQSSLILTLVALAPSMILLCMIPNWNGSASPTGRYLIEFLPLFMPAVAFAIIALSKSWQRVLIAILGGITFLITLDATFKRIPQIDNSVFLTRPYIFAQIQAHTGLALDRFLPAYSNTTVLVLSRAYLKIGVLYLVVLGLLAYGVYLSGLVSKWRSQSS